MSWFFFALICTIGWGMADLFYKKGTDDSDKYSHLKIAVWVGMVMGFFALILMQFSETRMDAGTLLSNAVKYTPASISYIVSMVIGYAGLRYLELSIVSPVQNASGAMSAICMLVFFLITGRISDINEEFTSLQWVGVAFIVVGVIALAVVEKKISSAEDAKADKKYRFGALALLFPLMYCLFDTIGTAADGIILDEETGLGIGEIDVLILYGFTFLLAGIGCYIYIWIKTGRPYNPFALKEIPKAVAACCEEFGQVFYVYAMAKEPVLAAPMVASYCIISVILSRIFVKEKLKISQYICVFLVIAGIVVLGITDGLAEM